MKISSRELCRSWRNVTNAYPVSDQLLHGLAEILFDMVYQQLADAGLSDEPRGMEYERVKAEWIAAGHPAGMVAFIRRAANCRLQ